MAETFDGVEQGELGAGMGAFAAHDQPGAFGPGIQVDEPGEVDDLRPVPDTAIRFAGGLPVLFLHENQGVADPTIDPVAERDADDQAPGRAEMR